MVLFLSRLELLGPNKVTKIIKKIKLLKRSRHCTNYFPRCENYNSDRRNWLWVIWDVSDDEMGLPGLMNMLINIH